MTKPSPHRRRRTLIGVKWDENSTALVIQNTFATYPAAGLLFSGDEILAVNNEPVSTAEDVVFHWERSSVGSSVQFRLRRRASHIIKFSIAASGGTQATIQWALDRAPLVGAVLRQFSPPVTLAGDNQEGAVQELQPGDLIVSVRHAMGDEMGWDPMSLPAQVDEALRPANTLGPEADVAVLRNCDERGEDADEGCSACACFWRTRIPKRAAAKRGLTEGMTLHGAPLLEFS